MQTWNRLPRILLVISLLIVLCAGLFAPRVGDVEHASAKPLAACPGGIITQWTFTGDVVTPSTGSGIFANGAGITQSFAAGDPDRAVSFTGWTVSATIISDEYVELSVDTTGLSDIGISFDYRSTGSGPTNLDLQYSTDGSTFTTFTVIPLQRDSIFHTLSYNLASISGLNNNPNTKIRLYGYINDVSGGGNLRLDDVTISEICPPSIQIAINEVAWAGTAANDAHEWIELYNPGGTPIDLTDGWRLVSSDGSPDIDFSTVTTCSTPNCTIPAGGYFLMERDTDGVISDISADYIYSGPLSNGGESLTLYSPASVEVDTANGNGGVWPSGNETNHSTMERGLLLPVDSDISWYTNNGVIRNGLDFNEDPIWGTPKLSNAPTATPTATNTLTPTNTFTPTPSITPTRTITPTSSNIRSVIINEVAWEGTASGLAEDEWIELYNPGSTPIDITDWVLKSTSDPSPDILLNGIIPAGGYFLLERDDDSTVSDIVADQIYTGSLSNSGEKLFLYDASNKVIDSANGNGGAWPRGSSSTYGTMERIANTTDSDTAWVTNVGSPKNGKNANGGDILGTPKNKNTIGPTPTPGRTPTPTRTLPPATIAIDPRPIMNEILPRPGYDWNQDGRVDVFDEFIEIKNLTAIDISLNGWKLSTVDGDSFTLPNVNLSPGERIVFYGSETNILLSDGGETVRLTNPSGKIYDAYTYDIAREEDRSICRLPDGNPGSNSWYEDCIPTPNLTNSREGAVPVPPGGNAESPVCDLPDTIPADFFFAECHGYGGGIWNPLFWDATGWMDKKFLPAVNSKWKSFIE